MNKPNVKTLVKLAEQAKICNEWSKGLPNEISDAFFDNPMMDAMHKSWMILAESYFGDDWVDLIESVVWLDELTIERPIYFNNLDGSNHKVTNLDELCEYLINVEGWEE